MELFKRTFTGGKTGRIQLLGIIIAVVVLALLPAAISGIYTIILITTIIQYVVMAVSWTIFSGKTGYISLASAAFFGIGAYMQAVLGMYIPLPLVMCISAIVCFAAAFGVGVVTLRLRGVYFTIFTFGLALFLQKFILWIEVRFFHTKGRMVMAYDFDYVYYCVFAVFVILIFVALLMNRSRFGLALDCIGQNEDSAQHVGVNTTMTKVLAFAVSAAPVGAVGAAMATKIGYIDPDIAFGMLMSFMPVLMAIFGGMNNVYGPIIGAVVFTLLEDYLLKAYSNQYMIIFGVVMVVAIVLLPKGLIGIVQTNIARSRGHYDGEVIGDVR